MKFRNLFNLQQSDPKQLIYQHIKLVRIDENQIIKNEISMEFKSSEIFREFVTKNVSGCKENFEISTIRQSITNLRKSLTLNNSLF